MKKKTFVLILVLFLMFTIVETVMFNRYGKPPVEPDPPQFKYQYVDIYKKFFKKVWEDSGYVYVCQKEASRPAKFYSKKSDNTLRIFVIGGSVAYNFYDYPFKETLTSLFPQKNFEIIYCGAGAYDSYRTYLVEKEVLSYNPDLIIVFSGNNEFYNQVTVNLGRYYLRKFVERFWLYHKLRSRLQLLAGTNQSKAEIACRDRETKLRDYEKNIRSIVKAAKSKKVPIILCTLPVNFRDSPPAVYRPLSKSFISANFLFEKKDYEGAILEFRRFLEENPDDAFGLYFLGRAYDKMEYYQEAKKYYLRALDLSYGSGMRASPKSNTVLRKICIEEKIPLADLELAFMDIAPYGLLGREQFMDSCHWYLDYNSLVAEVIINEMLRDNRIALSLLGLQKSHISAPIKLKHNFRTLQEMNQQEGFLNCRIQGAVFDMFSGYSWGETELIATTISYFKTLYLMDEDQLWNIQFSKGKIEEMLKDNFWSRDFLKTIDFDVYWPRVLCHVGEAYRQMGLYEEALAYFNKAILSDPDDFSAYLRRALTYYSLDDKAKARENIDRAGELSDNSAIKHYREILNL